MVLDLGVAGQLGGAVLAEGQRALVDAAPVEDPAERVGDLRVLGHQLLGGLGEGERPVLVAAVLGEDPGRVVGGGGEARIHGEHLLVELAHLRDVATLLVDGAAEHERAHVLRVAPERLADLDEGLIELP